MRHPLNWFLRIGRSRLDSQSLLGDLQEEHAARIATGRSRFSTDVWYTKQIVAALACAVWDAARRFAARDYRDRWRVEVLAQDLRSASRALWAAPGVTAAVLVVMTLAMGATTAIFSVVDVVALRSLPFDRPEQLVSLDQTVDGRVVGYPFAAPDFLALRTQQDVFQGLAAIASAGTVSLRRDPANGPEVLRRQRVSAEFFPVLRIVPALGRTFTTDNEIAGNEHVAIISHGLWLRWFGGATDVIGKRLKSLGGVGGDFEIIGVTPSGFTYPVGAMAPADLWTPYVIRPDERVARVSANLTLIARLRDNVSLVRAQARIDQIATASAADAAGVGMPQRPTIRGLRDSVAGDVRTWMWMLLAAALCILIIACANIANLLLVRASGRGRELGVRSALGATRWDLARLLLTESVLLSVLGTVLGILAAWWGVETLRALLPPDLPRLADIGVDRRVLVVSAVAAVVTGIGFGLAPVFYGSLASGRALAEIGRTHTASSRQQWLRAAFVVAEVAIAVILLVGTALFVTSFSKVMRVNVGLDYRNVVMFDIRPRSFPPTLENVVPNVSAIPWVESAAIVTSSVPFSLSFSSAPLSLPGRQLPTGAPHSIGICDVTSEYFNVLKIPLRAGRYFNRDDIARRESVAILNETAAKTLFFGEDPIGQRVGAGFGTPRVVIGVVADVRGFGPEAGVDLQAFTPVDPASIGNGTLLIRVKDWRTAVLTQVSAAIWSELPDLAMRAPMKLEDSFVALIAQRRFNMILLTMFGALGVTIAAVGIYGATSHTVSQRTREIGIRMALGAAPAAILKGVLRRSTTHVVVGLTIGLGLAWFLASTVSTFLFQVAPHDLRLYGAVAAGVLATAIAATLLPARRAARVDPLIAFRAE